LVSDNIADGNAHLPGVPSRCDPAWLEHQDFARYERQEGRRHTRGFARTGRRLQHEISSH
jgi:hypothetical protein